MSQNVDTRQDISQHDNRKRKLDCTDSNDDAKKTKLNASLGLSLLQAYDEEEQYSDEENNSVKDDEEEFESKCSDITIIEEEEFVLADDGLGSDEVVSCSLEENDAPSSSSIDTKEVIVNEEITNVVKTNESENISSVELKNDEITLDRLDDDKVEEVKDEKKSETEEIVPDTTHSEVPSLELAAVCTKETIENSSNAIRSDSDSPVHAEPKPVRKVKLNRSKFVQPIDESINITKISPPKSDPPVSDKISSVSDVPQNEIKLPELENSSAKTENLVATVEMQVATSTNVPEETIKEICIQGTTKEVDIEKTATNYSHEEITEEVNIERITEDASVVGITTEISIEETAKEISIEENTVVVTGEAKEDEETTEEISIEKTAMVAACEETTEEVSIQDISKENNIEEPTEEVSVVETTREIDIEKTREEVCVEETKEEIDIKDTTKEVSVEETAEEVSVKEAIEEMSSTHLADEKNSHSMTEELKVTGKTCSVLLTPLICKDSKIVQLGDEIDNVPLPTPCQVKIPQLESVKSTKPERTSLRTSLKLKPDAGIPRNKSVNKDSSSTKGSNSVTTNESNKELFEVTKETKIPVKDSSREISDLKVSGKIEKSEDIQISRIRDSKNEKCAAKNTNESLEKEEGVLDVEIGDSPKIEIPKNSIKFTSEVICVTPDEKERNLASETIEKRQDRTIQKPIPSKSKSPEISKLEQALTGRIENVQSHTSKEDRHSLLQKRTSGTELEPAQEDTKRNIKLHLSVQGDRVSIKNAHSISKMSAGIPVRVKRQYRKREKVPGELEAKQASAKEYANRLRQRAERETPGAKKRGRKKKNQDAQPTEIILDPETDSNSAEQPEEVVPSLKVAINKLPSRKSSVAGKVQPIKLKISKNANVTIECTSKYDVCSADKEGNEDSINVNEKIVGILEEARKKDAPPPSCVETASTAWSGPDLMRVERLLKESNITITPVATGNEVIQPPTSVLNPILNPKEKISSQVTFMEVESKTPSFPASKNEEDDLSVNASLRAGLQERPIPMNAAKSPVNEINILSPSNVSAANLVDVKSEIRKKIASVEKRKQEIHLPEVHPVPSSLPKTVISSPDMSSPSADIFSPENRCSENIAPPTDMDNSDIISEPLPTFTPVTHRSPVSATTSVTKHSNLPTELFPKKRGRPTKAMVAAREAYRQQQEEFEKYKKDHNYVPGELELPSDISIPSTPTVEPLKIVKRGRKPKHERLEKKDSDDLSYEESPFDPAREAEELRRVEEERVKKEEERERKNEIRRIKAKERSDLVKAKRLRQKMKAKERHKLAKELRRLQQEEKKKLEEQLKRLPVSMGFDDETRMSAENSQAANMSFSIGVADDDSSCATNDMSQKLKKSRMEIADSDSKDLMVDQVAEYQWPIQGGELYMIQEQVSNFLGVKSFKRKYPDIWRRPVDSEERAYLVDSGLVSETLCDLGITAVRSAELLDIMCSDFPEKYEEFRRYMREKQMKELSFKQRAWANGLGYKLLMADGSKQDMKKRAMESVSNWNSALNKSRIEDRRCHMDLQTFIIHHPKQRGLKMTVPSPKVGSYPVTILPGQFCDFYKEYTPTELRYLPVNTVLYGPLKHPTSLLNDDASQTDSDDSSSSDDSSTTSEDTQATEETLEEDIDKDLGLDVNTTKFEDKDTSFMGDEEHTQKETENDRILPSENDKSKILCKVCLGDEARNKINMPEVLISCSQCASTNHPTCLDLSLNVVSRIKSYSWQCPDCKICAQCKENADEDKMLFCDTCDRGYHIYCVGLIKVPAGNWQCKECTVLMAENRMNIAEVAVSKESHPNLIEITG